MARARMIKPEFCTSKTLNNISLESNLLFVMIWMHSDDYGTILNSVRRIFGECFPLRNDVTEKQVSKWLNELIDNKLLIPVTHNGNELLVCRSWEEHQKVPNISKRNNIDNDMSSDEIRLKIEELIQSYLESNESLMRQKLLKENDKENDNDKEKDKKEIPTSDEVRSIFLNYVKTLIKEDEIDYDKTNAQLRLFNRYWLGDEDQKGKWILNKKKPNVKSAVKNWIDKNINAYKSFGGSAINNNTELKNLNLNSWDDILKALQDKFLGAGIHIGNLYAALQNSDQKGFYEGKTFNQIYSFALKMSDKFKMKKQENTIPNPKGQKKISEMLGDFGKI